MRVALGSKVFLGRGQIRGPIPPLPLLEKEQTGFPGQGTDTARSLLVPGAGCSSVQPPHLCHKNPGPATNTEGSCQPWSCNWHLAAGRRITQRGHGCHWHSIRDLHPWRSAVRRGKVCQRLFANLLPAGAHCPCSSGLLWERQPQKPQTHPWIKDRL